jgi:hypothetical protein
MKQDGKGERSVDAPDTLQMIGDGQARLRRNVERQGAHDMLSFQCRLYTSKTNHDSRAGFVSQKGSHRM